MKMPIIHRLYILLFISIFAFTACDTSPVFPSEPKVEFIDIQPLRVKALQDSIVVTIRFQDGDGDLGAEIEGEINLELIDDRYKTNTNPNLTTQDFTSSYSLPNLTPDARNPAIQGEISVTIPLTAVVDFRNQEEEVRYQIKLWDRKGNLAGPFEGSPDNAVYTDYITVYR